jgi:hypothetical protein
VSDGRRIQVTGLAQLPAAPGPPPSSESARTPGRGYRHVRAPGASGTTQPAAPFIRLRGSVRLAAVFAEASSMRWLAGADWPSMQLA